jgi:predicted PurR-regulated permease PerM
MSLPFKIPFYAKAALISISAFAFVFTMHIGRDIIIPLVYATIIAILLNPLVNFLVQRRMNRIVSISFAVVVAIIVVVGVLYILSSQVSMFTETYPQLKAKFNITITELTNWVSEKFTIRVSKINAWSKETQTEAIDNFEFGARLLAVGQVLIIVMLLPVYLFMILFYKPLLLEFIHRLFRSEHHLAVVQVLTNTKKIIQSYLSGLFMEMIIIACLNSAGLLILGIDYAIILGITGAMLNIIPYIGGIIAIALPMIIAFVTKDSLTSPALVFVVYMVIQFIDNHYIVPKVVASRVRINALVSVIAVLIGGTVWGISGMFLSIPLTAIIKVIFDNIEPLKPWGFVLGNEVPSTANFSVTVKENLSSY